MRAAVCRCLERQCIPFKKRCIRCGNFQCNIRIGTQNRIVFDCEIFHTFRFHDRIRIHMEYIAFNRYIFMDRVVCRRQTSSLRHRIHINCRRILPERPSNAFDKKFIVSNRHVPNRSGFIPLVGIIGKINRRHGHIFKHISFNQNGISGRT